MCCKERRIFLSVVRSPRRCYCCDYYLTSEVHMDPITRSARWVCSFTPVPLCFILLKGARCRVYNHMPHLMHLQPVIPLMPNHYFNSRNRDLQKGIRRALFSWIHFSLAIPLFSIMSTAPDEWCERCAVQFRQHAHWTVHARGFP